MKTFFLKLTPLKAMWLFLATLSIFFTLYKISYGATLQSALYLGQYFPMKDVQNVSGATAVYPAGLYLPSGTQYIELYPVNASDDSPVASCSSIGRATITMYLNASPYSFQFNVSTGFRAAGGGCVYSAYSGQTSAYRVSQKNLYYGDNNSFLLQGSILNGGYIADGWTNANLENGNPAYQLCDSGGCDQTAFVPPPPNTTTRIISLVEPPNTSHEILLTPVLNFDVEIYNNISTDTAEFLEVQVRNTTLGTIAATKEIPLDYPSSTYYGDVHATSTLYLADATSTYEFDTQLVGFTGFPLNARYNIDATTSTFDVFANNGFQTYTGVYSTNTAALATSTCNIANITGCFQNAMIFLFYPDATALSQWQNFQDTLKTKPPVGYFYIVSGALAGATSTVAASVSWNIPTPIKNYIFTPFSLAIAGVLWYFFAVHFYHRLKHIVL
jgi:hypothetical protein